MVDTVHLVVRDLNKHLNLVRFLEHEAQDVLELPYQPGIQQAGNGKYIHFFKSDRTYVGLRKTGKFYNSRARNITYVIDETKDYILFNFSLAKYKSVTNVYQLIKDWRYPDFELSYHSNVENQIQCSFDIVFYQILHFVKHVLNDLVDLKYLELYRIDFCYNHVFENEQQKHDYFRNVKNYNHGRTMQKNYLQSQNLDSTVFWHSKKQSFKIYDKYPEFITNDFKEIPNTSPAKLHALELAKRTLRFEWTIRHTALSDMYKSFLYNERFISIYSEQDNPFKQLSAWKYYKQLNPQIKRKYLNGNPIVQKAVKNIKFINDLNNKTVYISFLGSQKPLEIDWHGTLSKSFYDHMLNKFFAKLNTFFNVKISNSKKTEAFDKLTPAVQKKLLQFDKLFNDKNQSYEQIAPFYPPSTFTKYKRLHNKCLLAEFVKVELTYKDYLVTLKSLM